MVSVRLADYQQKLAQGYNKKVRTREFMAVYWEGPYCVTATAGAGSLYLEDMEERPLPRPWNVCNLKKYYP